MNTYDEWARALEVYGDALGDKALKRLHTHISGIEYTDKGEKEHLPIQESDLVLDVILQALLEFECQGRILIESPIMEEDALMVQKQWQQIAAG
jgi:deoxyribonuclease-4